MFVTRGEIPAAIPEIREEMGIDLRIVEVVALVELRVTKVRSAQCRSLVVVGLGGAGWHRGPCVGISSISGGGASNRTAYSDERIEVARLDLSKERRELSVACVYA